VRALACRTGAAVLIVDVSGQGDGAGDTVRSVRAQLEPLATDVRPYVVAVGNRADAGNTPDGSQSGADAFLFRPVLLRTLIATVERLAVTLEARRFMLNAMVEPKSERPTAARALRDAA